MESWIDLKLIINQPYQSINQNFQVASIVMTHARFTVKWLSSHTSIGFKYLYTVPISPATITAEKWENETANAKEKHI